MLFNQTKQDRMRIFEELLFFKGTYNTKANKQISYLLPVGFLSKRRGHETEYFSSQLDLLTTVVVVVVVVVF